MISMKPIKLIMSAFGPYKDVQIIDFDLFLGNSIFLITGGTGSGKTTIFDGLCYALYGMASGTERDGESLRSHFSGEDRLTYVELNFLIKGEEYFIRRVPKQIRPVKKGEGLTEQKPEAELRIPKGKVITGIENVNDTITTLLGMNYMQFRQIVMIPQGEFRELLLADSRNREAIFRKIFGTYQFQAIQDNLDKKARELKNELIQLEQKRNIYIKSIDSTGNEDLKELINADDINKYEVLETLSNFIEKDKAEEGNTSKRIKDMGKKLDELKSELVKGKEINKLFEEEKEADEVRKTLEGKFEEYKQKEETLKKGRKALAIKPTANNCVERHKAMKAKEKEWKEAEIALNAAKENQKNKEEIFIIEKNKEPYRKRLSEKLTIFKREKSKVADYSKKILELEKVLNLAKEKDVEKENADKAIKFLKDKSKNLQEKLDKSQKAALEYVDFSSKLKAIEEMEKDLSKLEKEYKNFTDITKEYEKNKSKFKKIEEKYHEAKSRYEKLNDLFLKGQAGLLAQELEPGKPCPVCGAIEHPGPAVITMGTPTEIELKEAKADFQNIDESRNDLLNKLTGQKTKKDALNDALEDLRKKLINNFTDMPLLADITIGHYIKEKLIVQKQQINLLKNKINELVKAKDLEPEIRQLIKQTADGLADKEEFFEKIKEECIELSAKASGLKELINKMEEELPEGIKTIEGIEKAIDSMEKELKEMERYLKEVEENFLKSEKQFATMEAVYREKGEAHKLSIEEHELSLQKLDDDIAKAGFQDREDYKESRIGESRIEVFEKEIKDYYGELKSSQDRHDKALKAISGLKVVDISIIESKMAEGIEEKEAEEISNKNIYARLVKNKELQGKLIDIGKLIKKQEEEYGKVGYLAEMAKGNNSEKLSFERYVLAAYFDDIIQAANIRLRKMTDGRFELSRIKEKQKGGAQQGLDLEVYDYYTGRHRHVRLISGGESFKASLSLALGLSDVVQSSSGGVSIDTMLIDEGFGTLDPESLEKSIECLLELQVSGKFVGVISHVPELKERIRTRIEIFADITGSTAEIVVG